MGSAVFPLISSIIITLIVLALFYSSTTINVYLGPSLPRIRFRQTFRETLAAARSVSAETLLEKHVDMDLGIQPSLPRDRDVEVKYFSPHLVKIWLSELEKNVVEKVGNSVIVEIQATYKFRLNFTPANPTYMPYHPNSTQQQLNPYVFGYGWWQPTEFYAIRTCGYAGMFAMGPAVLINSSENLRSIRAYSYITADSAEKLRFPPVPDGIFIVGETYAHFIALNNKTKSSRDFPPKPVFSYSMMYGIYVDDPVAERIEASTYFNDSLCFHFKKGLNTIKMITVLIVPAKALGQKGFTYIVRGPIYIVFYKARKTHFLSRGHIIITLLTVFPATLLITRLVTKEKWKKPPKNRAKQF